MDKLFWDVIKTGLIIGIIYIVIIGGLMIYEGHQHHQLRFKILEGKCK